MDMTVLQTSKAVPERRAVPELKRQDGTYVPTVVPPEWQAYCPDWLRADEQ
jgi:hypothetical protein